MVKHLCHMNSVFYVNSPTNAQRFIFKLHVDKLMIHTQIQCRAEQVDIVVHLIRADNCKKLLVQLIKKKKLC